MNIFFYFPFMVFALWVGDWVMGAAFLVFFFCELMYIRIMRASVMSWMGAVNTIGDEDGTKESGKEGGKEGD